MEGSSSPPAALSVNAIIVTCQAMADRVGTSSYAAWLDVLRTLSMPKRSGRTSFSGLPLSAVALSANHRDRKAGYATIDPPSGNACRRQDPLAPVRISRELIRAVASDEMTADVLLGAQAISYELTTPEARASLGATGLGATRALGGGGASRLSAHRGPRAGGATVDPTLWNAGRRQHPLPTGGICCELVRRVTAGGMTADILLGGRTTSRDLSTSKWGASLATFRLGPSRASIASVRITAPSVNRRRRDARTRTDCHVRTGGEKDACCRPSPQLREPSLPRAHVSPRT